MICLELLTDGLLETFSIFFLSFFISISVCFLSLAMFFLTSGLSVAFLLFSFTCFQDGNLEFKSQELTWGIKGGKGRKVVAHKRKRNRQGEDDTRHSLGYVAFFFVHFIFIYFHYVFFSLYFSFVCMMAFAPVDVFSSFFHSLIFLIFDGKR